MHEEDLDEVAALRRQLADTEQRLSRLAAWVLEADREGHAYRLALPGRELPAGRGESQRRAALEALALWS